MNKLQIIVRENPFSDNPDKKVTTLLLNDVPLQQVLAFRFDREPGNVNLLTLQMVIDDVVMGE